MRQLFLDRGKVVVKEVCKPLLNDYSVLVKVEYSFISSGTELATIAQAGKSAFFGNVSEKVKKIMASFTAHGLEGTTALIKSKLKGEVQSLGYSCSGSVIAVGKKIKRLKTGDLVACAGAGYAHHADIVCVPEHLVAKVRDKEHLKQASITTLGAIALQGLRRAQLQLGELVCVIGLGLLGQLTVQLAKQSGCTVVGVDLLQSRLDLAQHNGADAVFGAVNEDIQREIAYLTNHQGVDATLITAATASDDLMQQAIEVTRKKGKVVIVGDVGLGLKRDPLYAKEIDVLISCSYGPGRYDVCYEQRGCDYPYSYVRWTENRNMQAFVQLIEKQKLNIDSLIGKEFVLNDLFEAYESIKAQQAIGVILNYKTQECTEKFDCAKAMSEENEKDLKKFKNTVRFKPATKDDLRVGMVGAGGFAKVMLMPIISKLPGVKISAVVDANTSRSLTLSRLYGAARALVNDSILFKEDLVDVVVIASPHKYHCNQAIRALEQGKAVFLEKPMVTDFNQLDRLVTYLKTHEDMPFCVDYNRAFSPFVQKIKRAICKRSSPLIINYRMNAGFIPKDHWVQTDVGAGRLIGEACHIFDLFYDLTQANPTSVSVESMLTHNENLFPTDNFVATINFDDGSICTLTYTSLGHEKMGKERMELFFDSKSIVLDDYKQLIGYGLPYAFNSSARFADKGHYALIDQFFKQLRKPTFKSPITLKRLEDVARLTLTIDALACEGGGEKEL